MLSRPNVAPMVLGLTLGCLIVGKILTARAQAIEAPTATRPSTQPIWRTLHFKGVLSEERFALADINPAMPSNWTGYTHLVIEMRTSSPQRFGLWVYTDSGPRRIEIQPFGQNAWLRASVPLQYFQGMDKSGHDLASTINRRTDSFWMSVWGPFGSLTAVRQIGFSMQYPINEPQIEIRSIHLSKTDEGSKFLESSPVLDEFGQWAFSDWPRKIRSKTQLAQELASEQQSFATPPDFGYGKFGGYQSTKADATGYFHVQQIDGVWWFIDPEGHYFLSTSTNGLPGSGRAPNNDAIQLLTSRLDAWGFNTGGVDRPHIRFLSWPIKAQTTFLGLPDVYADDFATSIDTTADRLCTASKNDQMLIGYFIGNEPPWGNRESEVTEMILQGPDTATKAKLKAFLALGDTPALRKEFVNNAFERYLNILCAAVRKYDPNHLNLGIRFGGNVADNVLRASRVFDVCSINVYEYEPTKQLERAYRLTGRPILIGEFHIGVPENGLGAGLVQAMNQTERGKGYRYFVEQGLSLPYCLGAHWFTWRDEPVLGRNDGENYNIGFVDVTNRPYPELVAAAKITHRLLFDVHSGKTLPFADRPRASEAGTPSSPWDN